MAILFLSSSATAQTRGWGRNNSGQLGVGNFNTPQPSPVTLSNSGDITGVSAGEFFTLYLKADGTVLAAGDNTTGQLGDGTQTIRNSPVPIVNLPTAVVAISASQLHSLALLADGTMMAWGRNAEGQIGNGGGGVGQFAVAPMPVINLTNVVAIASGGLYSLALKSDGTVWAWGSNSDGQLGNGATPNSNPHGTPTQVGASVAGFNNIIAISAGVNHAVALKSDGTVWVWGSNVFGELGNGASGGNQLVPIQNSSLSGVSQITAGWHFTHALKPDGTVFSWGYNVRGNLGNGTTNSTGCQCNPSPALTSINNVVDIKTSDQHTLARKSDGSVWAWGWNLHGQLGNGSTVSTGCQCLSLPAQVAAAGAGNAAISAGYYHSFAATPSAATPAGSNVILQGENVSIAFDSVVSAGTTGYTAIDPNSTGLNPGSFTILANSAAYNVTTTAAFSGNVKVCLKTPTVFSQSSFNSLAILHGEGSNLVNRTFSRNYPTREICAQTTSLSPFVLAQSPTAIELASFAATAYEDGVLLEWRTGVEVNNLGFRVYRDESGKRESITTELVAGSALRADSTLRAGEAYALFDKTQGRTAAYWLEDVDLRGQSTWRGPFYAKPSAGRAPARAQALSISKLASSEADTSRVVEAVAALGRPTGEQGNAQAAPTVRPAVKISIKREGWYRVTQPELAAAGLSKDADPRRLQLFVDGREIAISVIAGKDGRFDESSAIEFYGIGLDTPSTDARTYFLFDGNQDGLRIQRSKWDGPVSSATSFTQTVERRDRAIYFSALRNGDRENFFGSVIAGSPVEQMVNLPHLDPTALQPAVLEVTLQGVTRVGHRVMIEVNGALAGYLDFNAQQQGAASLSLTNDLLREGVNRVRLTSQNGPSDVSLVDSIRFAYQHTLDADDDGLKLEAAGREIVTVAGFSSKAIRVFDVTDAGNVQEARAEVSQQKAGYAVTFAPAESGLRRMLITTDDKTKSAARVAADLPSNWRNSANAADFVIITTRGFFSAIEPLAAARRRQGLSVALVDVEDIFDEFSFGHKSPQAIRDFLSYANTNWRKRPRYVLFAGDASFDPRNYFGFGETDLVPTRLIDTQFLETASDDWFADFDDDGLAELSVGRLPARTAEEVASMVGKIIRYDQSKPSEEAVLVADRNDGFDFVEASLAIEPLLTNLRLNEVFRSRFDDATAKKALIEALNRGQKIVNYAGHGSVDAWRGGLLTSNDARELENSSLPIFVMMNCLNGYFQDVVLDSLGESLMKAERGGAVAVWASSGITIPDGQALLDEEFYRHLSDGRMTIGEAIRKAKAATSDGDIRRTWILLGDPTMRVK